jgi:hypothetical protein
VYQKNLESQNPVAKSSYHIFIGYERLGCALVGVKVFSNPLHDLKFVKTFVSTQSDGKLELFNYYILSHFFGLKTQAKPVSTPCSTLIVGGVSYLQGV